MIFQPSIPVQGHRGPEPIPTAQGARQDPPWTGHSSITEPLTYTHTHPDWDNADTPIPLTQQEPGVPGENPADMGEHANQSPPNDGPCQESVFFLSNVLMKWH